MNIGFKIFISMSILIHMDSDGARSTGFPAVLRNPLRVLAVIFILLAVEGLVVTGLTHL